MMIEDITKRIKTLNKEIEDLRRKHHEEIRPLLAEAINNVLKHVPEIYSISWTQFTPYFNDGEECFFTVGEPSIFLSEEEEEELVDEEPYIYSYRDLEESKRAVKEAKEYEKDPEAWKDRFLETYYNNHGRPYSGLRAWISPYIKNVEDAEHEYNKIKNFLDKYDGRIDVIKKALDDVSALIYSIPDDVLRELYGDHVRVFIDCNGTRVEDYEHD
jgi:hypothetical protein